MTSESKGKWKQLSASEGAINTWATKTISTHHHIEQLGHIVIEVRAIHCKLGAEQVKWRSRDALPILFDFAAVTLLVSARRAISVACG